MSVERVGGLADDGLLLAEKFVTVQGEGPSIGQPAVFLRTSRCNLHCPGCDTPFTWDATRFDLRAESTHVGWRALARWVLDQAPELVVITGGEPLLQQRHLLDLVGHLIGEGRRIEFETNGTVIPAVELDRDGVRFNVSPKLAGFAAPRDAAIRINVPALAALRDTGRAVFKFVVSHPDELEQVAALADKHALAPVWVMPEGTTERSVLDGMRALVDPARALGFSVSPRLHILLWGDDRGR
ncbi:7-carboxy-7-deazaguanine synthase QueE [Longispora sp. NPDC051575]|uniref:7-carboxy-7-deazaguanine synthase QueE n=1 Tax=Longispora sp. NPDC051575 TaxID=3154943 RepID=UPI0034205D3F